VQGWVGPNQKRTTPKADALSPSQDVIFWSSFSIFRGAAHAACGGATKDEISPPFEGVQEDVPPYDIVPS